MTLISAILGTANPPLPELPTQFEAIIEANIVNKNYTVHMLEWYDQVNDRGRVDWYSNRKHMGSSSIYDFARDHYYHVNKSGCYWGDIKHIANKRAFMSTKTATPHLTWTANLWRFGGDREEIYMGQEAARGILCNKWRSSSICEGFGNACDYNYTLDYFFSVPSWSSPEAESTQIPIRAVLKGRKRVRFDYRTQQPLPTAIVTEFYHIYDFTKFHLGSPSASNFERPCGMICSSTNETWNPAKLPATECPTVCNVKNDKPDHSPDAPTFPSLPDVYEAIIEINNEAKKQTIHRHEWFDVYHSRERTDLYSYLGGDRKSSNIFHFTTGRFYHTNRSGCFWGDRETADHRAPISYLPDTYTKGHVTLTRELFGIGDEVKKIYMGQESVRGILCDKWKATISSVSPGEEHWSVRGSDRTFTLEYFFSASSWSIPVSKGFQIPIRVVFKGDILADNHMYEYTSFHVNEYNPTDYERPCNMLCVSSVYHEESIVLPRHPCYYRTHPSTSKKSASDASWEPGSVAAITIILFLVGVFIGFICTGLYQNKCAERSPMASSDDLGTPPGDTEMVSA